MNASTRQQIKALLQRFLDSLFIDHRLRPPLTAAQDRKLAQQPEVQPFHEAILSNAILRASSFERSFSTRLGVRLEQSARIIALENYQVAKNNYKVLGAAPRVALTTIDSAINDINQRGMTRSYPDLVSHITSVYSGDLESLQRPIQVDLFLQNPGVEIYFEMKSPQPDKDQCLGTTAKLLRIHAVRRGGPPAIQTYYAMAYNPYHTRENYHHSFARQYLDMRSEVLLGVEFWDLIGGPGTFDQILDIFSELGRENRAVIETLVS